MVDSRGENIEEAGPSVPVEVLGLNGTPAAGDEVAVVENEARAREVVDFRQRRRRDEKAAAGARGGSGTHSAGRKSVPLTRQSSRFEQDTQISFFFTAPTVVFIV